MPTRPRQDYSVSYSRPWYINARWWLRIRSRGVKSLAKGLVALLAKLVVVGLILAFPAVTAYHWSDGASIEDAVKLTTWDIRFVAKCYDRPATIPHFIAQNSLGGAIPKVALLLNGMTVDEYLTRSCNGLKNKP